MKKQYIASVLFQVLNDLRQLKYQACDVAVNWVVMQQNRQRVVAMN